MNTLLDTGEKAILVIKWQKTYLNCAWSLGELRYLTEKISKQSVEVWSSFSMVLTVKY